MIKSKIFYITLNDCYNGVYQSQVIDVVNTYQKDLNRACQLIAFVPFRLFFEQYKQIKQVQTDAIVLPMFPFLRYFSWCSFWLYWVLPKYSPVMCRGILATYAALKLKKAKNLYVVYDGRAAVCAEQAEFGVYNHTGLEKRIKAIEQKAVQDSDYRLAVSERLVAYWAENYGYQGRKYQVIPCTLAWHFLQTPHWQDTENVVKIAYLGSSSSWQDLQGVCDFLRFQMQQKSNIQAYFFCQTNDYIQKLQDEFSKRVFCQVLAPKQVPAFLSHCDYGLIFRDNNISSQCASPVKFAEYLACGLKILMKAEVGDFSNLIVENLFLGEIIAKTEQNIDFSARNFLERETLRKFALDNFAKNSPVLLNKYQKLFSEHADRPTT
jgi:hypothetical protein